MISLVLTLSALAHAAAADPAACEWQTYTGRQGTFDYRRAAVPTQDACKALCCADPHCVAATATSSGAAASFSCFLQNVEDHTFADNDTVLFRRRNKTNCGKQGGPAQCTRGFDHGECTRFDEVQASCAPGFSANCPCFADADCEQNQMDLGASKCTSKAPSGLGACTNAASTATAAATAVCGFSPSPPTNPNAQASEGLDMVFILGTSPDASLVARFVMAVVSNFTVAPSVARVGLVRAGMPDASANPFAAQLLGLGASNATIRQILSMSPTPAAKAGGMRDALTLSKTMLTDTSRRRVVIAVSSALRPQPCAVSDVVSEARDLWASGIEVLSVSSGDTINAGQKMIASDGTAPLRLTDGQSSASRITMDLIGGAPPKSDVCGRRCGSNSHCSGSCGLCGPAGTCGQGTCALPIPPKDPNFNVSQNLQLVIVVDVGASSDVKKNIALAGQLGLNFTTAEVAIISYSAQDSVNVSIPLGRDPQAVSRLSCMNSCDHSAGTGGLAPALTLAATMLNSTNPSPGLNSTTAAAPLQVVVVVSTQVRADISGNSVGPVQEARELWADGVEVYSVISDELCSYGPDGYSSNFECFSAPLLGSGANDSTAAVVDFRGASAADTSATLSAMVVEERHEPAHCDWQSYSNRRVALGFYKFHARSEGLCVEACCRTRRCKAASVDPLPSGRVRCTLHHRWQLPFTQHSEGTTLFRKVDESGCKRHCTVDSQCRSTGCPRCNNIFKRCEAGYKCGCSCTKDVDCDHTQMDIGCSVCAGIDQSGFGRCRSKFCGQACKSSADCADAPSCPICGSKGVCSPPTPDPIPDNCVAPFPGHPHKNCSAQMDLMLLLDGSGSIYSSAWLQILHFTAQIGLNFTTGHDFMRYGIVQFGSDAELFMPLLASNSTFQQVIGMMPQFESSTNTFSGMAAVEKEFNAHARPGAFKAMVRDIYFRPVHDLTCLCGLPLLTSIRSQTYSTTNCSHRSF